MLEHEAEAQDSSFQTFFSSLAIFIIYHSGRKNKLLESTGKFFVVNWVNEEWWQKENAGNGIPGGLNFPNFPWGECPLELGPLALALWGSCLHSLKMPFSFQNYWNPCSSACSLAHLQAWSLQLLHQHLKFPHQRSSTWWWASTKIIGSLSMHDFEMRTASGSELFSLITPLYTITLTMLSTFSRLGMTSIKMWETPLSWHTELFSPGCCPRLKNACA